MNLLPSPTTTTNQLPPLDSNNSKEMDIEIRCQFLDQLVHQGLNPPTLKNFSIFPKYSPLHNLSSSINKNSFEPIESEEGYEVNDEDILELRREVEELRRSISKPELDLLPTPPSIDSTLTLESTIQSLLLTISHFISVYDPAQLPTTSNIQPTTRIQLPYNPELGYVSNQLFDTIAKYNEFIELIRRTQLNLDKFCRIHQRVTQPNRSHPSLSNMYDKLLTSLNEIQTLQYQLESIINLKHQV